MADGEDSMAVMVRRRRFTLDEYHRMGETGILGPEDRVELIEGEIIEMSPIGSRHAGTVARIQHLFSTRLGDRAVVWVQNPLLLVQHQSEPEPDIILLEGRADFYVSGLPEPPDVRLLIEVAESSLPYDRRTKLPLYARAGVAEAWLVDLDAGRLEIHRAATGGAYRDVRIPRAGETFSPGAFADLVLTLRDLLG
ncbi:MAG TPA: Uma2 family endonuclease [Methylomirabilota bacterium]|jgi:Uma2 family endonuclease|nr:Uma2 family endonuclease [Methylomirabilota bacterium]